MFRMDDRISGIDEFSLGSLFSKLAELLGWSILEISLLC
jgi:hypothetical protein